MPLRSHASDRKQPGRHSRPGSERGGVTRPVDATALSGAGRDGPTAALLALWPSALVQRDGAVGMRTAVVAADAPVLEAMIDEIQAVRAVDAVRADAVRGLAIGLPLKVLRNSNKQPILMFTRTPEIRQVRSRSPSRATFTPFVS